MKCVAFPKEVWWNGGNMKGEAQGMGLRPRAGFGRRNHNQRKASGWSYLYTVAGAVLLALALLFHKPVCPGEAYSR